MGAVSVIEACRDARGQSISLLARQRVAKTPRAAIFTRTCSGIATLDDLRGKRFAFQAKDSTTTVFGKAQLARSGIRASDLGTISYATNAGEVLSTVENGEADAGTINHTLMEDESIQVLQGGHYALFGQLWVARAGLEQEAPELFRAVRAGLHGLWAEVVKLNGEGVLSLDPVDPTELEQVTEQAQRAARFDE